MNTNERLSRILEFLPEATIEEDGDGFITVNTYLRKCYLCESLIKGFSYAEARGLCDSCFESECNEPAPETMEFYQTTFTGTPIASCTLCTYKATAWECSCELSHDCDNYQRESN